MLERIAGAVARIFSASRDGAAARRAPLADARLAAFVRRLVERHRLEPAVPAGPATVYYESPRRRAAERRRQGTGA